MLIKHKKNKSGEHFLKEKKNKNLMRGGATLFDNEFITRFETIYVMDFIGVEVKTIIDKLKNALIAYIREADGVNEQILMDSIRTEFETVLSNSTITNLFTTADINKFTVGLTNINVISRIISFIENDIIKNYITSKFNTDNFNINNQQIDINVKDLTEYYLLNTNLGQDDLDMSNQNDKQIKDTNDEVCREIQRTLNESILKVPLP